MQEFAGSSLRQIPNIKPMFGKLRKATTDKRINPPFSPSSTASPGFFLNCWPVFPLAACRTFRFDRRLGAGVWFPPGKPRSRPKH